MTATVMFFIGTVFGLLIGTAIGLLLSMLFEKWSKRMGERIMDKWFRANQ